MTLAQAAITLEPQYALALIVAVVGALSSFFAVKSAGAETQRLVKALHSRFDKIETEVHAAKEVMARHDERIKALKQSQRMRIRSRLAAVEAERAGEPPMFIEGEDEG